MNVVVFFSKDSYRYIHDNSASKCNALHKIAFKNYFKTCTRIHLYENLYKYYQNLSKIKIGFKSNSI